MARLLMVKKYADKLTRYLSLLEVTFQIFRWIGNKQIHWNFFEILDKFVSGTRMVMTMILLHVSFGLATNDTTLLNLFMLKFFGGCVKLGYLLCIKWLL
jgi:hypothetical protein